MCERCQPKATGLSLGSPGIVSVYLMGMHHCKHAPTCKCSKCERYRDRNPYADKGVFFKDRPESQVEEP